MAYVIKSPDNNYGVLKKVEEPSTLQCLFQSTMPDIHDPVTDCRGHKVYHSNELHSEKYVSECDSASGSNDLQTN